MEKITCFTAYRPELGAIVGIKAKAGSRKAGQWREIRFGITYQFNFSPGIEVGHVHQARPLFNFRQQNMNKPRRQRSDWRSDRMMGERNPAVHQLNFVKTACEVAKLDLTDLFDKYGFFFVGTLEYDDYVYLYHDAGNG
ncbi:hypothetical protein [Sphingobacterium siyangense]|uniref:hypothetical protein n=2 Tax=Sphingobacterium TaxID=28453 RepID=UPI003DA44B26